MLQKNDQEKWGKRQTRAWQLLISHRYPYSVNKSRGLSNSSEKSIDHAFDWRTHWSRLKKRIWFNPSRNYLTYELLCRCRMAFVITAYDRICQSFPTILNNSSVCLFMVCSATCWVLFFRIFSFVSTEDQKKLIMCVCVCPFFRKTQTSSRALWSCFKLQHKKYFAKIYGTLFFRLSRPFDLCYLT